MRGSELLLRVGARRVADHPLFLGKLRLKVERIVPPKDRLSRLWLAYSLRSASLIVLS